MDWFLDFRNKAAGLWSGHPPDHGESPAGEAKAEANRALADQVSVRRLPGAQAALTPWTSRAKVLRTGRELAVSTNLDTFRDGLSAARRAGQALHQSLILRVQEAAELELFEARCRSEVARHSLVSRARQSMTEQFVGELQELEARRGAIPPEILDSLRECAFREYMEHLNRISRSENDLRVKAALERA